MLFECMQDLQGQFRLRASVIFQLEMRTLVFLIVLLFLFVLLRLFECRPRIRVRVQRHGLLPFRNGPFRLVHPVIRPAFQLVDCRARRRQLFRSLQVIYRLLELALLQVQICHIHHQNRLIGHIVQRRSFIAQGMFQIALRQFELRRGMVRQCRAFIRLLPAFSRLDVESPDVVLVDFAVVHRGLVDPGAVRAGFHCRWRDTRRRFRRRLLHRQQSALFDVINDGLRNR